jgi:transposase
VPVSQVTVSLSAEEAGVLAVLLPHLAVAAVDRAEIGGGLVSIWAHAAADGAACPDCGVWCTKVQDSYTRRLRDAAAGGRRVLIWLLVRLLRCGNADCPRKSFAEQPEGLASRHARKTPLLAGQLAAVAGELAGRAGARLAGAVLAAVGSRHTLIRVLMAAPEPAAGPVRVLGADDFSLRRGRTYATLLADMQAGRPVDVLPDREAATLRAWLEAHPEVEVICRDRAGAYAQAARDGAPGAVQVADRWHLWHNLCGYVRAAVARHRDCLAGPGCRAPDPHQDQDQDQQAGAGMPADPDAVIRGRHAAVRRLRAGGATLAGAAAALGLSEQRTSRFWRAATAEELLAVRSASALDPYKPYLRQRLDQDPDARTSALHREITARGYAGSYGTSYAWLAMLKLAAPPRPPAPPDPAAVTGWILQDPARLAPASTAALDAITARCPVISALAGHASAFAVMLLHRHGSTSLDAWLDAAAAGPAAADLQPFLNGIRHDYQAVRNGLTLSWNSGLLEGLNTRTKLLKRQMYGRASFPLLRKRILLTTANTSPLPSRNMRQSPNSAPFLPRSTEFPRSFPVEGGVAARLGMAAWRRW